MAASSVLVATADGVSFASLGPRPATQWAVPLRRYQYEARTSTTKTMVPPQATDTAGSFPQPGLAIGDGQPRCSVGSLSPKQVTSNNFLE
jgi:hypothetical protein